jgi:hypothetical protein
MNTLRNLLALLFALCVSNAAAIDAATHRQQVETWRAARVERLKQPTGWLSLVGLHWLQPGRTAIGSAVDTATLVPGIDAFLRMDKLPARLGTLDVLDGHVFFVFDRAAGAQIDGAPAISGELALDVTGKPSQLTIGTLNIIAIERSGRIALRVRDAQAPTLTEFAGLDYFSIDRGWRIDARFEPHPPGKTIDIATVINTLEPMANPGAVVFQRRGKTFRLEAVDEGDGRLFLIFADRTNGKQTYGAGRFLYADPPAAGSDKVVIDFNESYNPPCVFTPFATCPLPPPENRLDLAVTAGEKKYAKAVH